MRLKWGAILLLAAVMFACEDTYTDYSANGFVETNHQLPRFYMEEDAAYQASVNKNDTVMVYCAESTLQQILALSHAMAYNRANPSGDIIYLASKDAKLVDDNSFFNTSNIHFIRSSDAVKPFTPDRYDQFATLLNARPYKLYIVEREFWRDWLPNHLVLFANAESVNMLEEGLGTYNDSFPDGMIYTRVTEYEKSVTQLQQLLTNMKSEFAMVPASGNMNRAMAKYGYGVISLLDDIIKRTYLAGINSPNLSIMLQPWILAQTSKVTTWWQHPQAHQNISLYHQPGKQDVRAFYNQFSPADKSLFTKILQYDLPGMNSKYWDASPKPNLVLIGTHFSDDASNPNPEIKGNKNMMNWLRWVIDEHGAQYDILFKPHPRYTEGHAKMFAEAGIEGYTMIDDSFPFEMIELTGAGAKYCSTFSSSLYFINDKSKLLHVIDLSGNPIDYNNLSWKSLKRMGVVTDNMYITPEAFSAQFN